MFQFKRIKIKYMQKTQTPYITELNSPMLYILLFFLIIPFSCNNPKKPAIDFDEKYYRRSIHEISVKKLAKSDKPIKFNYTIYYHHAEKYINHGFVVNNFSGQKLKLRPILNTRFDSVFFNKFLDNEVLTSSPIGSTEKKSLHHLRSRLDTLKLCQNGQKIFAFLIHNENGDTTNFEVSFQLKQLKTKATFLGILFSIFQILAIAIIFTSFYFLLKDLIKGEKPGRLWFIYKFQEIKKEVTELRDIKLLQKEEIESIKKNRDALTLDLINLESELAVEKAKTEELSRNVAEKTEELSDTIAQKNKKLDQLNENLAYKIGQLNENILLIYQYEQANQQNENSLREIISMLSLIFPHEKFKEITSLQELVSLLHKTDFFKKMEEYDMWRNLIGENQVDATLHLMSKNNHFTNNDDFIVIKSEYTRIQDSIRRGLSVNSEAENKVKFSLLALIKSYQEVIRSAATRGGNL